MQGVRPPGWAPLLWVHANDHMTWCGNVVNLSRVGAAWAIADLASMQKRRALFSLASAKEPPCRGIAS